MHIRQVTRHFYNGALVSILILLASCATQEEQAPQGPIFYPPLPNSPRIQYLKTFSSERDISEESGGFADFILGKAGESASAVQKPYGVTMYKGSLFVVDTRGPGYVVFDLIMKKTHAHRGSGGGRLKKPINITIDSNGERYITDTGRDQIIVFDDKDQYVRAYGVNEQFKPSDVALSQDKLFVSDLKNHKIQVLSKDNGSHLYDIGSRGSKEGQLLYPTNLELAADGFLYVTDTGNFRVQKFSQDGKFVKAFGKVGSGPGQFARPKGISVDAKGNLYIVDAAFENVQIMNADGHLLLYFGAPGNDQDSINLPTDIEIDYENIALFQQFADPDFQLEYVILVASQFGNNKVNAYGFGKMKGMNYEQFEKPSSGTNTSK